MSAVKLNDITISYDDIGHGEDVLVLLHGHPFDRSMWRPQCDALGGKRWRLIVPDLRGYGESTVTPSTTTLDMLAHDVAALLDHLGIDAAVIGGLSMGGQIVMAFCHLYPQRVRGVVLAATFPQAETDDGKQVRNTMADRLLRDGMEGYAAEVLPRMVAPRTLAARPDIAAHVLGMMRGAHPIGAAAALRGRAERPCYDAVLSALPVPALIVVGDEDAFTTRADAERMHTLITGSTLVWMPGVGHMPNLEHADAFNAALESFLLTFGSAPT
ncbi:alpha/beta fold hydrolase [Vineibacter terrae]|uniref:Alpha/beta fold hydrolase n=2 Tax=Vineibacter terrae TaxID=2586908 RepID=A0A5C8P9K3_9HYPH|nr:alpha/beta fold hydrolase [Vineibacter terrae]